MFRKELPPAGDGEAATTSHCLTYNENPGSKDPGFSHARKLRQFAIWDLSAGGGFQI